MTYKAEFGDYDEMYGGIDYEEAVVLDIGADYGTTAAYFIACGAVKVFVSERNEEWVAQLREAAIRDDRIMVVQPFAEETAARYLKDFRPDVVKVDCEGCERFLLGVPKDLLTIPRGWVIETHTLALYNELSERFRSLGYRVTLIKDYGQMKTNPDKVVRILQAVRDA